jgi:ABC-type glycerol-3-phosphate transport system substrate-binding protein
MSHVTFMKLTKQQGIMLIGGVVLAIILVLVVILNIRPSGKAAVAAKLSVWGIEDKKTFYGVASGYPYATVSYTQIDPANYDAQILSALAAGTGPDVFEIGDRSVPRWKAVITPMPAAVAAQFGPLQIANTFPDVVSQDFVQNGQTYALPLSIDTLAMIYNKDMFNSAGIAIPPSTWNDFQADVAKIRSLDGSGKITQAGAALGGTETSVLHAPDIIALFMLQNGTTMVSSNLTSAQFASETNGGAGLSAFNFYLQFANAASPYYTWNDQMGSAADNFAAGKVAVIFGYQSDLAAIQAKAPFLNIGIAPMPQPTGATIAINYPSYEGFAASKAGQSALAWNFIVYLTASDASEKMYLSATGKPPALRTEIQADANDPSLSVFAAQALTARSWYEPDDAKGDSIFNTAIGSVLTGESDSRTALNRAQASIDALFQQTQ